MLSDEGSVDVVEHISPNLANVVHLVQLANGGVTEGVDGGISGVGVAADTGRVVEDVGTRDPVLDIAGLLLSPSGRGVSD